MKIAGLDIGTTGCKLTVFDENGRFLSKAYRDYPVKRAVDSHELDVGQMMGSVYAVIEEEAAKHPDIGGIGVTSFGETFVMTDEAGEPLHNAMLYTDPRGKDEVQALIDALGERTIAEITGLRPHEMYSIGKIMWIKSHCPAVYAAAKHIFLIEDYVVWHLCHNAVIDYSLASRTMAFDIRQLTWSKAIFDAAGIDQARMSTPVPTGTAAGKVTAAIAQRTGLCEDCQIISVSHDQLAAAVGAGVFGSDTAVDGAGTVQCLTPIYDQAPDVDVMFDGYFSVVPYIIPGKYAAYAFSYTGGALIQWCVDTLAKAEQAAAKEAGISVNAYLEQRYTADEPTGLLVLPHFAGAATPYMDTGSKGAIVGLTTAVDVPTLYRACMEGVVYEMRLNYDALKESGVRFSRISATGGGARSQEWMQMKADVLNMPVTSLKTVDAGTVGCAMLTGVVTGVFKDLDEAAQKMVEETATYYPRPAAHEAYMRHYRRYKQLYAAVRPLV